MTRSIHDNYVLGYAVDVEGRAIVIHTEFRDRREPFERTDIHFTGVLGYLLHDSLGGILFDIEERPLEDLVGYYGMELEHYKQYGWPWPTPLTQEQLDATSAKIFFINSSIGFDGFVVAKAMSLEAAT
jgi:hypothetical protein